MRLSRPLGGMLALVLAAAVPAFGADINDRQIDGVTPVKLEVIMANPQSLLNAEVKFRCTFASITDIFDLHQSYFRMERYAAFAVWNERSPLWIPEARADVITTLYVSKDRIAPTRNTKINKYSQIEVAGIVKEVVDGVPFIEVTGMRLLDTAGALTDAAIYHVEQAIVLTADGSRDLADEHFAKALATDLPLPARIAISVLRGRELIDAGKFDVAAQLLSGVVVQARSDLGLAPADRATLYALLAKAQSEFAERGGDASQRQLAVANARKALEFDPANGEAYAVLGICLAGLGQYDEARRNCDNAVRLLPADAEVRWYLGRILDQQGRGDDAIEALKKAIDLTPKDHRIHKAIASAYYHRGQRGGPAAGQDLSTALREYDITLRLNPTDAEVVVLSGNVIEDAAKIGAEIQIGSARQPATTELALARYASALQLNPKFIKAWRAQGLLQASLGMEKEARASVSALRALGAVAEATEVQQHIKGGPATLPVAPAPESAPAVEAPAARVDAPTAPEAPAAPVDAVPAAAVPAVPAAVEAPVAVPPVVEVPAAEVPAAEVPAVEVPEKPAEALPVAEPMPQATP